jgi:hypothetical protein
MKGQGGSVTKTTPRRFMSVLEVSLNQLHTLHIDNHEPETFSFILNYLLWFIVQKEFIGIICSKIKKKSV